MTIDVKYETGVIWQDFQHKQLIDLFNQLREARFKNKDEDLYRYTLAFLAMYTKHHFSLEEEYIERYDYPQKEKHFKEHRIFIKTLKKFRRENLNYSEEQTDRLLTGMGEWILEHILGDDIKLGKFILKKEQSN